ncbi:hypothetical protein L226DRAFT_156977 [Lentinus tigrinus ALCF2SS1-7]|uniref:Uncharacterized protein n=1 Tax=Lentinus tigrinus ALCF2SS1-6 TaxID=1328759 RepID=A0A5C2S3M0_9APHY|nr:hypothetical protein L227DRAFT_196572 [Lentinus tigrinus ALCF2SS1-6]RPD72214.1 hypothetical protein L226DRAFT_156977 [Lentinus tigrinus ALCF2SS1-7]
MSQPSQRRIHAAPSQRHIPGMSASRHQSSRSDSSRPFAPLHGLHYQSYNSLSTLPTLGSSCQLPVNTNRPRGHASSTSKSSKVPSSAYPVAPAPSGQQVPTSLSHSHCARRPAPSHAGSQGIYPAPSRAGSDGRSSKRRPPAHALPSSFQTIAPKRASPVATSPSYPGQSALHLLHGQRPGLDVGNSSLRSSPHTSSSGNSRKVNYYMDTRPAYRTTYTMGRTDPPPIHRHL